MESKILWRAQVVPCERHVSEAGCRAGHHKVTPGPPTGSGLPREIHWQVPRSLGPQFADGGIPQCSINLCHSHFSKLYSKKSNQLLWTPHRVNVGIDRDWYERNGKPEELLLLSCLWAFFLVRTAQELQNECRGSLGVSRAACYRGNFPGSTANLLNQNQLAGLWSWHCRYVPWGYSSLPLAVPGMQWVGIGWWVSRSWGDWKGQVLHSKGAAGGSLVEILWVPYRGWSDHNLLILSHQTKPTYMTH